MGRSKAKKFVRSVYEEQLRSSYGDLSSPHFQFVRNSVTNREPFDTILRELGHIGPVADDTDTSCDVCFTYVVNAARPLIVKLSMVGPYAVILTFGEDGLGVGALVSPLGHMGPAESDVASVLTTHGFTLLPSDHLEQAVSIALVEGRDQVSLYAALFEPEGQIPWTSGD
ncbi:hypothetical protein ACFWWM_07310 [Streptomyces sp. NPDC058682]|uniref:hypothetical protein n=1 Tax=Streptomyces sp. NPDC058682 TaxID=3346596 RepID=UPI0036482F5D